MKQVRILLIIVLAISISGCDELISERGNGNRVEKAFTVDSFNEIELSGGYDVTLVPSTNNEIIINADENLLDYIKIDVRGSKLIIGSERSLKSRKGIKLTIPVKELEELTSSGASNIYSDQPIICSNLLINLSGAGKLELNLKVESVRLTLSGASLVYLEGTAQKFKVVMSGAGSIEAEEFEVENCTVDISGIGSATVNVTGSLEAQVSGLGSVKYVGSPNSVIGDVSGIGEVGKSND